MTTRERTRPSHPPTLLTLLRRTLVQKKPLAPGEFLLLAVSGGPDSIALLHGMARLAPSFGVSLAAHGVDHGLREEAAAELDLAQALATSLGVPFARTRVDVAKGANVQARARTARREALVAAADAFAGPTTRIATAHHADDRAETVLLRVLRGSPLRSLAPLPLTDGRFVRPLIDIPKRAIDQHVDRHRLAFATDPSNADPRYLRARVRHEVLPMLRALDPAIDRHLNALADEVATLETEGGTDPSMSVANLRNLAEKLPLPASTSLRTKRALNEAMQNNAQDSQVFLPGGLVALYDRQHLQWVVRQEETSDVDAKASKPALPSKRSLERRHRTV